MTSVLAGMAALSVAACGGDPGDAPHVTVSAASSLRAPFEALAGDLEAAEGITVTFNFDASSSLASHLVEGAPADVFASAAPEDMARVREAGIVDGPEAFARNRLAIVTPRGNPQDIAALSDLADAGVVSLCDPDVPCGRYAARALAAAGVTVPEARVSRGPNVTATLGAVADGDAAAAVVYRTDALAAGDAVDIVAIDGPAGDVTATYLIGVVETAADAAAARAFVDRVLSDDGRAVLEEHGFLPAA